MTYQYLKVEMVEKAKENGGFVDQKNFKNAGNYGFDSLILSDWSLRILESYISNIRPVLKPRYDYVLVTRSGAQFTKLSNLMSKLVYDSIGKYYWNRELHQPRQIRARDYFGRSKTQFCRCQSSLQEKTFTRYCYQSSWMLENVTRWTGVSVRRDDTFHNSDKQRLVRQISCGRNKICQWSRGIVPSLVKRENLPSARGHRKCNTE